MHPYGIRRRIALATLAPISQTHGCGESHLAVPTGDNVDEARNRRVEIFLFEDHIDPPPASEPPGGCAEYPQWVARTVLTLDLADPEAPAVAAEAEISTSRDGLGYFGGYYGYGLVASGSNMVTHGSTLVFAERGLKWNGRQYVPGPSHLVVADMRDPDSPGVVRVRLEPSLGFTGLVGNGSIVATSSRRRRRSCASSNRSAPESTSTAATR